MALPPEPAQDTVDARGDDERFRIHARIEIVGLLRAVATHREIVTVQDGESQDCVVSALLAVNPDREEVVLDHGADEHAMRRLLRASHLRVSTQLQRVRIQFAADVAGAVSYEGKPAFRIRLPRSVLRFQRRDTYRLKIPLGRPLICEVPPGPNGARRIAIRVHDISVEGIGLTDYPKDFPVRPGMLWRGCHIPLPGLGTLVADILVMRASEGDMRRCGCRFCELPFAMTTLVQRYITRVEREQHLTR